MAHTDPPRTGWRARSRVLVLAFLLGFAGQGARGLYETTEGRYAEVGREMARSGDWLVPRLEGAPHWTKPPLTYWAIGAGVRLLGNTTWAARLPNALAIMLATWTVMGLAARLWPEDPARAHLAGLLYVGSPFVGLGGALVGTDLLLALCALLGALCYWEAVRSGSRWAAAGTWLALGLGFLTKGPAGLLVGIPVLVTQVWLRRRGQGAPRLLRLEGPVLFGLIGLGWYAWSIGTQPGLLRHWLIGEVWERATGAHRRNPSWWALLPVYGLPLTVGLGAWLPLALRAWRRHGHPLRHLAPGPERVFLLSWGASSLLLLSAIRSHLPLYVLPLLPAELLLLLPLLQRDGLRPARAARIAAVSVAAAVLIKLTAAALPHRADMRPLADAVAARANPATAVLLVDFYEEEYGLQYYLDGRVQRAQWCDYGVPPAFPWLRQVLARATGPVVLVTRDRQPDLAAWLETHGYRVATRLPGHLVWSGLAGSPPG